MESTSAVRYAGFWRRVAAFLIDLVIVSAAGFLIEYTLGKAWIDTFESTGSMYPGFTLLLASVALVIAWLYSAGFESAERGATPGKMALRITVRGPGGARLSFARASLRFVGKLIAAAIFGIGFLMAAWTLNKQALEDFIAGSQVLW